MTAVCPRVGWWPLLVVTSVLVLHALRAPAITINSDHALRQFGLVFAVQGSRIASIDGTSEEIFLRIDVVDEDGDVTPEARFSLGSAFRMPALAMRGDTIVAHLDTDELRFFQRTHGRWIAAQTFELPPGCRRLPDSAFLGDTFLVVDAYSLLCVLEPGSLGLWRVTRMLDRQQGETIAVSRDRIVLRDYDRVRVLQRVRGEWMETATIRPPAGTLYARELAASDRWLVVRDETELLHVYDLDARGQLVQILKMPGGREAREIAVGPTTIVTTDDIGGVEWRLTDGWRMTEWLEFSTNTFGIHPVAIGDFPWIGAPLMGDGGSIHGFPDP